MARLLLYGAYGYTGRLIARKALQAGLDLTLAGRDRDRLSDLAAALDVDWLPLELHDAARLKKTVAAFDLVIHAAGPFVFTYKAMAQACLHSGTHYVDIGGEIPVLEALYSLHDQARSAGITILPGAAFAVVAGDCLANHVVGRLENAAHLELAFRSSNGPRPGSTLTAIEQLQYGGLIRRHGAFCGVPFGWGTTEIRFHDEVSQAVPIPWGDLAAAARSTDVPNIITYVALSANAVRWISRLGPPAQRLGKSAAFRHFARWLTRSTLQAPADPIPGKSAMWARAADESGEEVVSWLSLNQVHLFSAEAAVRCAQGVLESNLVGALTPAQAFGPDFVLDFPGVQRFDG